MALSSADWRLRSDPVSVSVCVRGRLEAISLAKCYLVTDMGLAKLSAACPRLHSISLESTKNLTEAALFTLAAGCKELRSINLKLRGPADLAVTDAVLEKLGVCCPLLRSINIMSSLVR